MSKSKKVPSNYFHLVNPLIIIVHIALFGLLLITYFKPEFFATNDFGPLSEYAHLVGTQYKFYLKLGLLVVLAVHILETLCAVYKCQKLRLTISVTIAWALQTLCLGICSLRYLLWLQRPSPAPTPKTPKQTKAKAKKQK
ncbi:transmembrane protein 254 [Procambarus clarkii]|uniref:transmembrane protein 254 n=1 Tax=Procambarus clarkii TaxID=6728 RepID=UPI001E678F19|nr:uncharacterized protein LOC123767972 [Procambarus clarkii]